MSDLHVVAVITAKAGHGDIVKQALSDLVGPTRAEEGCLHYELYESSAAPDTFVTVELWRSPADLDAHVHSPHLAAAMEAAGDAFDVAPAIHPLVPLEV